MPFPIVPVIIAALGAATATVMVLKWDQIVTAWKYKRIAVLGTEQSGKSVLIKFLTSGRIPDRYEPTQAAEQTRAKWFQLEELELNIRRSKDVPGLKIAKDQWKDVVKDANVVLYLVRANLLLDGDEYTRKRLVEDTEFLRKELAGGKQKKSCFIIGGWADKIPGYRDLGPQGLASLQKRFTENQMIRDAAMRLRTKPIEKVPVIIGSQEFLPDQQQLVTVLVNALKED